MTDQDKLQAAVEDCELIIKFLDADGYDSRPIRLVLDALAEAQSVADAYEKHAWARLEDDKKRVNES